MSTTLNDLEKVVNSDLTTAVKKSEINFDQLFIVTYTKPKIKYDANSLINESYVGQKMVLRKFLDIGVFYYK